MNEIKEYTEKIFEDLKHIDGNGNEYWYKLLVKIVDTMLMIIFPGSGK
ncbi:MAG: hypothetical protein IJ105_02350 [Bacilli bacterium]|nr:hypothetical protein [Bacilli bacterium]